MSKVQESKLCVEKVDFGRLSEASTRVPSLAPSSAGTPRSSCQLKDPFEDVVFSPKGQDVDNEQFCTDILVTKPRLAEHQAPPVLQKMSNLEQSMRNEKMFSPAVEAPSSIICGLCVMESAPTRQVVKNSFIEMLEQFARFSSSVNEKGEFTYIEPEKLDWEYHLRRLPVFNNDEELDEYRNKLLYKDLDDSKPLWKAFLGRMADGRGILFLQIHHCLADGICVDRLMRFLCKTVDGKPLPENPALKRLKDFKPSLYQKIMFVLSWIAMLFKQAWRFSPFYPYETDCKWTSPLRKSGFVGKKKYKVIRFPELEVITLKKIKNYLNSEDSSRKYTVNDVMFGIISGTARRYCEATGTPMDQGLLRASTYLAYPSNAQRKKFDPRDQISNNFSVATIEMPVHRATPLERVKGAYEAFQPLKTGADALCTFFLAKILFYLPSFVNYFASRGVVTKNSTSFSNVAGPSSEVTLFGKKVLEMSAHNCSVNHSSLFLSYNGKVRGTFLWDHTATVEDEELFRRCFTNEYESLQNAVRDKKQDTLVSKSWCEDSSTDCTSLHSESEAVSLSNSSTNIMVVKTA